MGTSGDSLCSEAASRCDASTFVEFLGFFTQTRGGVRIFFEVIRKGLVPYVCRPHEWLFCRSNDASARMQVTCENRRHKNAPIGSPIAVLDPPQERGML